MSDAYGKTLGIVGAGKIGTTIARAAIAAGYEVLMSGSGSIDRIALTVEILAPGTTATTTDDVAKRAQLIILAVPTHRFRELPSEQFAGKILVDAMNYWEPIDGNDDELKIAPDGTSVIVQAHFPSARVVKSLNQLGYHEFEEYRAPAGATDRVGIAAASDDQDALARVMALIEDLGFDSIDAGPLRDGRALGPEGTVFGLAYTAQELVDHLSPGKRAA